MALHNAIENKDVQVAILPFSEKIKKTSPKTIEQANIKLTNSFTKTIWKKNKVRIINKKEVLATILQMKLTACDMVPEMKKLDCQPNYSQLYLLGNELEADIIFCGTVRENSCEFSDFEINWLPLYLKIEKNYKIGIQMMALDIQRHKVLAFDYVEYEKNIYSKFKRNKGDSLNIDERFAHDIAKFWEKCGYALAYYAPMPEKPLSYKALETAISVFNKLVDTDISIDYYIEDLTWQMYPPNYFMENFGYTYKDLKDIPGFNH